MKFYVVLIFALANLITFRVAAIEPKSVDDSDVVSKEEFWSYKDVSEFIDGSPKVTIMVQPEKNDIDEYGAGVMKAVTGSDCDRDGIMDDSRKCKIIYYKLWLKYKDQ